MDSDPLQQAKTFLGKWPLEAEARQCIGEEAGGFGEGTTVSVRVNPNIPTQDTTQYPVEPITPERPLVTSPIR